MKIFCHQCNKQTNHTVHAQKNRSFDPNYEDPWGEQHRFSQCAGCDAYTYSIEAWTESDWNPHSGETESTWLTYPRAESERQPMSDEHELPAKVRLVYKEVISAMNAQLTVLSGIGLRALIEATCRDQQIAGNNLQELIDGLAKKEILSQAQASILHAHRFLGNAAAHEVTPAQPRELVAALLIAENVLRTIYVLPKLSKQVKTGQKP